MSDLVRVTCTVSHTHSLIKFIMSVGRFFVFVSGNVAGIYAKYAKRKQEIDKPNKKHRVKL